MEPIQDGERTCWCPQEDSGTSFLTIFNGEQGNSWWLEESKCCTSSSMAWEQCRELHGCRESSLLLCMESHTQWVLQEHVPGHIKEKWLGMVCINVWLPWSQSHLTTSIALCDKVTEFVDEGRAVNVFVSAQQAFQHCFPAYFDVKVQGVVGWVKHWLMDLAQREWWSSVCNRLTSR